MIRGMAPLLPLGFAILGLGCTVPLTIGGDDFEQPVIGPSEGGDGGGVGTGSGGGSGGGTGGSQDSGVGCLPSVAFQITAAAGVTNPITPGYSSCCNSDDQEGRCITPPVGWDCTNSRVCTYNGGACFSTGHTCSGFGDCCTAVCYKGLCASDMLPLRITPFNATGQESCHVLQETCQSYTDCCSQNCAFGYCLPAPVTQPDCGGFEAPCKGSSDCCSMECLNGLCYDTTLPWYLQTPGAQLDALVGEEPVETGSEMAPRFQLNRVEDVGGRGPMR
jgi:hypothetical protein